MNNGEDPTARRRQDREAMNERDAEAWQLQRQGWSVRSIGRELGMAPSSVQRCLQRAQRFAMAATTGEPRDVVAALDDELSAEDVRSPADVARLGGLERYRLQFMQTERGRAERARVTAEREAQRQRFAAEHADAIARDGFARVWEEHTRTPVSDGTHWREGVDRAISDDSGVDADEW